MATKNPERQSQKEQLIKSKKTEQLTQHKNVAKQQWNQGISVQPQSIQKVPGKTPGKGRR